MRRIMNASSKRTANKYKSTMKGMYKKVSVRKNKSKKLPKYGIFVGARK